MIRAHVAALKVLLGDLRTAVTRAEPDTVFPYVVLHPNQGAASTTTFSGSSDQRTWTFTTTCVGSTAEQAEAAAERVWERLLDAAPAVTGRVCFPIRNQVSVNVIRDEDVQPPVYIARDVWAFISLPN